MLTRRHLLGSGAAALVAAPALLRAQGLWRHYPFSLGVAAGDPSPDGFVIWTRIAPDPLEPHGGMGTGVLPVKWEVASDERFQTIVARGEEPARPELAHSVHVEVSGLQPDRPYFYRFEAAGEQSIRGAARTFPVLSAAPQHLRFGVAGCQNYEDGYYAAYRYLAKEDVAFVFHYGDYIYEYRSDPTRSSSGALVTPVRQQGGDLLMSLDDYRRRYAQYKSDVDLQRAHAAHAFFMTFDDHEVADNWAGDTDEAGTPPEIFRLRRAQAFQAWYEHVPVRRQQLPNGPSVQGYRGTRFGNLAALDFLDTRQFRTDQPCGDGFKMPCPGVTSPTARMISSEEETWLARDLQRRDARWNVIAQQVMMMSLDRRRKPDEAPAKVLNLDSWAGYEVPRERLLSRMRGLDNVIVLTGDEHQNFAGILNDRDKPVAVEFVSTSISSGGDGQDLRPGSDTILANNPQLKFINDQRGYVTCDVTPDEWRTNFMVLDRVSRPDGALSKRATWSVTRGEPALRQV
ncbi:MAG: alkaline phosphatase D family protein [Sphingomonas sp.]